MKQEKIAKNGLLFEARRRKEEQNNVTFVVGLSTTNLIISQSRMSLNFSFHKQKITFLLKQKKTNRDNIKKKISKKIGTRIDWEKKKNKTEYQI